MRYGEMKIKANNKTQRVESMSISHAFSESSRELIFFRIVWSKELV
jgi:hypothetical protein